MTYRKKIISLVAFLSVLLLIGCSKVGYSGSEGGRTKYQDVKTDVVELTVYYYSDTPPVSDVFIKTDEGTFFNKIVKNVKGKYMFDMVKVGDKGQIVIPVKARKIFDIKPGDNLVILGDENSGLAILKEEELLAMMQPAR